jgi:hypothetical protein
LPSFPVAHPDSHDSEGMLICSGRTLSTDFGFRRATIESALQISLAPPIKDIIFTGCRHIEYPYHRQQE